MAILSTTELQRRDFLRKLVVGAGGMMLSPLAQPLAEAGQTAEPVAGPKRFVFFLQNQGLHPVHCRPKNIRIRDGGYGGYIKEREYDTTGEKIDRVLDEPLSARELPDSLQPLAPYVDRMSIVQYLNGNHIHTFHGAGYGALGGAQFAGPRVPSVETIDCALAKMLPAPFPLLSFGWQGLKQMQANPISYCSSAWGERMPAPGYSDPNLAHSDLFGAGGNGDDRALFDHDTEALERLNHDVLRMSKRLSGKEQAKFQPLVDGYEIMSERRRQLIDMADKLRRHAPEITEQFTLPKVETDWREAGFEVATAALVAGLTNVVTFATGMCNVDRGPFDGFKMTKYGHNFGHTGPENPDWITVHSYNMRLLVKLINTLQSTPEGNGSMMDHTLIVYTSCHAESQHSKGDRWPFVLIGDLGGKMRTGRYIHYPMRPRPGGRAYNAMYSTLLQAAGSQRDTFNLVGSLKEIDRPGPLEELLV